MSSETIAVISVLILLSVSIYLFAAMIFHIRREKRREGLKKTWKNFSLSIAFCILFLTSWAAHGLTEFERYRQDQKAHGEQVELVGFVNEFSAATLENWQSEFLQLFSFVVMAALFIHHGSAESKDSDEKMEAALKRIEQKLEEMSS